MNNCKFQLPVLVTWMLLLGLFPGFGTDFVLEAAERAGWAHSQPQA